MDLNAANNKFNENGLVLDVFTKAKKSFGDYSHINSNSCLSNTMAAIWAKENQLNDAVMLNNQNRISDTTLANIFIVQNEIIQTPALSEACICGVQRKYLLKKLSEASYKVAETQISLDDLQQASEVFLANAVYGLRWVKQIGVKQYKTRVAKEIHKKFIEPNFL
jgi:branched-subunit amino acid aminotransferase/4-amino-4-deoxychorismate lyase